MSLRLFTRRRSLQGPVMEISMSSDVDPGLIAAQLYARLGDKLKREASREETEPALLGYAVIETDSEGNYPSFCVHGPDPVDTDYAHAHDQWRLLTGRLRPDSQYFICKLVPVEPVEPEGDPEDRLPFDWVRTDQKIADGLITDPVWAEIHEESKQVRQELGLDGTMAEARKLPHPYIQAEGHPFDKVEHRLEQYCAACGAISSLIAHKGFN
ncbi:hypothetical protein AB0J63_26640 [Streptosporangium canum]|uniref:hypothetical protein n=1 Tax=Streptosporangium canum TaxID=324952 RepID=UPI0034453785